VTPLVATAGDTNLSDATDDFSTLLLHYITFWL